MQCLFKQETFLNIVYSNIFKYVPNVMYIALNGRYHTIFYMKTPYFRNHYLSNIVDKINCIHLLYVYSAFAIISTISNLI